MKKKGSSDFKVKELTSKLKSEKKCVKTLESKCDGLSRELSDLREDLELAKDELAEANSKIGGLKKSVQKWGKMRLELLVWLLRCLKLRSVG